MSVEDEDEATPVRYDFDEDFQKKILALTFLDRSFTSRTEGLVNPDYFENEADRWLIKLCGDYYKSYRQPPGPGVLSNLIRDAINTKRLPAALARDVLNRFKDLKGVDLSDAAYVTEQVADFARHQAVQIAILESVKLIDKREFGKIESLIKQAINIGANENDLGVDYFGTIDSRTDYRKALVAGAIKPDGISTGYKELDELLYHGGWGRKELSLMMAPAKGGKSMSLADFGKNATLLGKNVLIVTLEVSARIIADRLDASFSSVMMKALKDNIYAVKKAVDDLKGKTGLLKIHEYASGTFKASQLRRLLEAYRARGITFDLVIVDYADIMAAERFTGDLIQDSRAIYIDLRAIAFEYDCALLTATQTNREGAKAAVSRATDVAEDFNKIRTADIVIGISATEAEIKSNEARLTIVASRNSETGVTIRVRQDRSRMQFVTKVIGRV